MELEKLYKMTKHFKKEEFDCPCCKRNNISPRLVAKIDQIREEIGKPIIVTSGYRCKKHNKEIGGAISSKHLIGMAVDITTKDIQKDRFLIIEWAIILGIKGIGISKVFIHLDIRTQKEMWLY